MCVYFDGNSFTGKKFGKNTELFDAVNGNQVDEYITAIHGVYEGLNGDNPELLKKHLEDLMSIGKYNINSSIFYDDGITLLYKAVVWSKKRPIKCIKIILEEMGANPNIGFNKGWDALVIASECEDLELMRLLPANGAKVNRPETNVNALCQALRQRQHKSDKLLIENGADIYLKENESGKSPLEIANEYHNSRWNEAARFIKKIDKRVEESN